MPDVFARTPPKYYALKKAKELSADRNQWVKQIRLARANSGRLNRWRRNWWAYYGRQDGLLNLGDNQLSIGTNAHRARVCINHFRSILLQALVLTTSSRPDLNCRAGTMDIAALEQTTIGNAILEQYLGQDGPAYRRVIDAVEHALLLGSGYIFAPWKTESGNLHDVEEQPDGGSLLYFEGDLEFLNPSIVDVYFDPHCPAWEQLDDVLVRTWVNKYDLAAKYPELEDRIEQLPTKKDWTQSWRALPSVGDTGGYAAVQTNKVEVFHYFHRKSGAISFGRMSQWLADDTVLEDEDLLYADWPLFRIAPGELIGTPEGWAVGTDLAPLQEANDDLFSIALSNQRAFGQQGVLVPRGSDTQLEQIKVGLGFIHYTPGPRGEKPESLQLTHTPAELFSNRKDVVNEMGGVSGVNSTSRGAPPPGMDAGVSLGLMEATAIQHLSPLQDSFAAALQGLGLHVIDCVRTFSPYERQVTIVGEENRESLRWFSPSKDLARIRTIHVELGNPLGRTIPGRMQMAKQITDAGLATDARQLLQVMDKGRLEPITKGTVAQLTLVALENERFLKMGKEQKPGEPPPTPPKVLLGDDDPLHIKEHLTLLNNPDVRDNAPYVQAILQHVQQHIQKWGQGDTAWGIARGQIPPGFMQQQAPQPGGGPGPGAEKPPPPGAPPGPGKPPPEAHKPGPPQPMRPPPGARRPPPPSPASPNVVMPPPAPSIPALPTI